MSVHRLLTVAALAGFVTALAGCGTLIGLDTVLLPIDLTDIANAPIDNR